MRRAKIRLSVDLALADNGYSRALYNWSGAKLRIWDRGGRLRRERHFPSGTSRKRFIERISTLPVAGPVRPANNYAAGAKSDGYHQTHLEDFLGGRPA